MVENISRYIEMGDKPLDDELKGSAEIGFTIISLTVSLIAVLIPLLFMGDIVGRLFREFAVTLAVTIIMSAIVSLTLTPMRWRPRFCTIRWKISKAASIKCPKIFSTASSTTYGEWLKIVHNHQK